MSQVFVCECGRRTTDPFVIRGVRMCVICAEDADPRVVDQREKRNYRSEPHVKVDKSRYGRSW